MLPEAHLPPDAVGVNLGYQVLMLDEDFPFDVVGVLAACSASLAAAGIPIMVYSSYATDIFLIQAQHTAEAQAILAGLSW